MANLGLSLGGCVGGGFGSGFGGCGFVRRGGFGEEGRFVESVLDVLVEFLLFQPVLDGAGLLRDGAAAAAGVAAVVLAGEALVWCVVCVCVIVCDCV